MLRAVFVVAAAIVAVVASGVGAPIERPDAPIVSVLDQGTIDRDDFDGGNGGDG